MVNSEQCSLWLWKVQLSTDDVGFHGHGNSITTLGKNGSRD